MRILYCNKYNFRFSGTESYLFDTMELMRARGHEAALFSMADSRGTPSPYDRHFVAPADFKMAQGFLAKSRMAMRAIYSLEARKKIRAMIKEFRPDVAHVRNIYHHLTPSILWELKAQRVPVLYHMNDMKLLCPAYNMVGAAGQACEKCKTGKFWNVTTQGCYNGGRRAAVVLAAEAYVHRWLRTYKRCVNTILVPSGFVKEQLMNNGWRDSDIRVLPHFQQIPSPPVPHPGPNAPILYFGRLSAEKGVADLIKAMSQIPELQLIIAGEGPQRHDLEQLVADMGLSNVTFAGQVTGAALDDLISHSQFTAFPSRAYETLGKSILESFAHGRAVVASDLGSRQELVNDGATGVLYQAGNVLQLVAAIKRLQHRPELARAMGEAARTVVSENHSVEHHLSALIEIYEELASNSQSRRKKMAITLSRAAPPAVKIAYIGGRGVIGKYSGIETYYEETGKRLAALGYGVTLYCRSHFTPQISTHNGMRIVRLPTIRSKHLETLIHTALSTLHVCFSRCDVVHYHALGPALFSFFPRLFGKKTVVTVQGLDWQRRKWSSLAQLVLKAGEWAAATLPSKTVVVSNTLQRYFRTKYKTDAIYIPNGADLRAPRGGLHLEQFGLRTKKYVLFLGRLSPEKNCDLLIDAFEAAYPEIRMEMKLVFAGGSSYTSGYADQLRKRQTNRILVLDWIAGETFEELLTNAALFVLPSDMEGMSLSLLEAMGAGVCVLASDTPENQEVIADCGFTFRAGEASDLQRMLCLLLNDDDLREASGKSARTRVNQLYLWKSVTAQIDALYRDLVPQPAPKVLARPEALRKSA